MALTFFFDRCFGKGFPEAVRHAEPPFQVEYYHDRRSRLRLKQDLPDDEWVPIVAQQGWFILSHDKKFHKNEVEYTAIKQHRAGCFYLHGNSLPTWYKLRAFIRAVDKITKLAETTQRPFIFRASRLGRVTPVKIP